MTGGVGVLIIAIGAERYIRQAETLILSLRHNMPALPIAVVTDSDRLDRFGCQRIAVDYSMPIATAQKLLLDRYSPFDQTLFIDSDCIVTRAFDTQLRDLERYAFTPVLEHLVAPDGQDPYVADLGAALAKIGGRAFPKFNGGIYFFRKGETATTIFSLARQYFADYPAYGIKAFDRGGPGDETVLALAMAATDQLDLYDDSGLLMRTPTGILGPIHIEPLGGGTRFRRAEGLVEPAICHFAGHFIFRPEYLLADEALRRGVPISGLGWSSTARARLQSRWSQAKRFLKYKKDGIDKRLRRMRSPVRADRSAA